MPSHFIDDQSLYYYSDLSSLDIINNDISTDDDC